VVELVQKKMKMDVTYDFLNDWFSNQNNISRLGHFGNKSRIDKDILYKKHQRMGGKVPYPIYQNKKEYCLTRPLVRPEQNFQDFTKVDLKNKEIYIHKKNIEFCSFIGFRADEHVYAPLVEFDISQKDIKNYWDMKEWDLGLPYDGSLGNCVYCFMKGGNKLSKIDTITDDKSPENIDWWIDIEKKYQRDLIAENRDIKTKEENPFINFFGVNGKISYEIIKNGKNPEYLENSLPCNCTD